MKNHLFSCFILLRCQYLKSGNISQEPEYSDHPQREPGCPDGQLDFFRPQAGEHKAQILPYKQRPAGNAQKKKHANNNLNRADYLLAFAQYYPYGPNYYIFGGMYKVEKILPEVFNTAGYKLTLMDNFAEYRKRLIIRLEKPIGRDIYNKPYLSVQRDFNPEIYELAPSTKLGTFPGYNNVLLHHKDLQAIIKMEAPEWKSALSNVKGVYCITDRSNGHLYIGSASGNGEGIWQRWKSYADIDNLTGGNKTFEEIKIISPEHIVNHFTYSLLEIFDIKTKREDIIHREEHWKRVFQTVKFGMNNAGNK